MNGPRVTLLDSHDAKLRGVFDDRPGLEAAAVVLFTRIVDPLGFSPLSDRFVSIEVHPLADDAVTGRSAQHVAYTLDALREHFRRCDEGRLVFGFVHNHPAGPDEFSSIDDENEQVLLRAICNRNGGDVSLVSLLWAHNRWQARVRNAAAPNLIYLARHVVVVGRPLRIDLPPGHEAEIPEVLARQAAAFGEPFVRTLKSLRVGVIGQGGTGSPTSMLLARAGVGELVLIDRDNLEKTNLNRVRGPTLADVGRNKALVLQAKILAIGLETKVATVPDWVDSPDGVDAIASCDVLFGCTDDQVGRDVLNLSVYVNAQPLIDVGLGGVIDEHDGQPRLRYHHGRISTLLPEQGECLFCQGVISSQGIQHDYALRANPKLSKEEARERYLEGGGEQAPGVGPFTSATADFGVATLFDLVRPFRKFSEELRWDAFNVDFIMMMLNSRAPRHDADCPYCATGTYVVRVSSHRLGRPALGRRHVAL